MNCNPKIHNEMITMKYVKFPFCEQQLQDISIKHYACCDKQSMINDNAANICKSCGTFKG